jgi:hypothetical protein
MTATPLTRSHRSTAVTAVPLVLRVLAAAGLGISAYVHLHLAARYGYPGTINGTDLFRAQGAAAAAAAVAVLAVDNPWVWRVAGVIGLVSLAAVLTSRYASVGAIGPLPDMTDHTWQPTPDKPLSAVAEGTVALLWLAREWLRRSRSAPLS